MTPPPPDELPPHGDTIGVCYGCGQRRVLCAFGQCVMCHVDSSKQGRLEPVEQGAKGCASPRIPGRESPHTDHTTSARPLGEGFLAHAKRFSPFVG